MGEIFDCLTSFGHILGNLDVTPFGEVCYWSDQTGPLGEALAKNGFVDVPRTSAFEWNTGVRRNEARQVIPGYGKNECVPLRGNGVRQPVTWNQQKNLPEGSVSLKFYLTKGDIYSYVIS